MVMKKNIIVVDIDGTITKVSDRLKYLQQKPKDWDSFYEHCDEDEPVMEIIDMVDILSERYKIVFCTGRRESVREKTQEWMNDFFINIDDPIIIMRPNNDYRHDTEMKPELLQKYVDLEDVSFVLEDRNSMVQKWRELGLTCLQVADGDF
jgi:acid phosphatase class B